jgi:hypothetical protein
MKGFWWALGLLTTAILAREAWLALVVRRGRRRTVFALAQGRARVTGKPLVVVGNPAGGVVMQFFGPDYECGSICVDLNGCPSCETQIVGRLEDVLPRLGDASAVVFVANALEFVDDISLVALQLDRISGGDLFITHVESASLVGWFWPGVKRRILFAPPESPDLIYKTLPWHPEAVSAPLYVVELPGTRRRLQGGAPAPLGPVTRPMQGVIDTEGESL